MFFGLNSPSLAELIVNGTELDFVAVELQHAQVSSGDSTAILRAVQATDPDVTPLVRLPDHSVYWIQQSLDAGFTGMIVPLVESAEQTESLVRAAYFPPLGDRSSAGSIRAVMYALEPDYYKVGLIVEALVHVHGATGDSNYLDAAVTLYNDTITRATDLWTNTFSHKTSWAATTLHAVTGEVDYLNHACRFADYIVGLQQPDAAFTYPELWPSYPPEHWEGVANICPQFALWITRTLQTLEGVGMNG